MISSLLASLVLIGCQEAKPPCTPHIAAWDDLDGDGYGGASLGMVCKLGEGMVEVAQDCDDEDDKLNPDAVEICDGVDNDCDGIVDEDSNLRQFWYDHDGDGFGGRYRSEVSCQMPGPEWVLNTADCDDNNATVNPDGLEVCGGVDEDCDGYIDESDDSVDVDSFSTFFADKDGDTYGDEDDTLEACRLIPGYVLNANDCNDDNPLITRAEYYRDTDEDGYGDPTAIVYACAQPPPGTVDNDLDCDDNDPTVSYDTDWFEDPDGDGYGSGASLAFDCIPPNPDAVAFGGDCDENDPLENPGTPEDCTDGIDNNCDNLADAADPTCLPPCADEVIVEDGGLPIQVMDSTVGMGDDDRGTCHSTGGIDMVYHFIPAQTRMYTIDTNGSTFDTTLYVRSGCGGVQLACDDDGGNSNQSWLQVSLQAGVPVLVVVDAYSTYSGSGPFTLTIQ